MKKFMAVYIGTADGFERSGWNALDPEARKARQKLGMDAWMNWGKSHAGAIVEMGTPLGKTKRVAANGITDYKNNLTGYTIVEAETHEAAAKIFENHPHFTIFPGDSVEVVECLPMPGS